MAQRVRCGCWWIIATTLVAERTRLTCRLRWHLHELDPAWDPPLKTLNRYKRIDEVIARLDNFEGLVARLALEQAVAIRDLIRRVNDLEREIKQLVTELAPTLLAMPGCGVLSAAKIVGETADITRFKSKDAFARHNGTAPLPVWSGNRERFRLSRAGNRQLNCAIHRIAVTQGRFHPPAKEFLERRMKLGNTRMEAVRAFKRRLSDVVYRDLLADAEHATREQLQPAA